MLGPRNASCFTRHPFPRGGAAGHETTLHRQHVTCGRGLVVGLYMFLISKPRGHAPLAFLDVKEKGVLVFFSISYFLSILTGQPLNSFQCICQPPF